MNKHFLGVVILIYLATGIAGCRGTIATETDVTTLPVETKTITTTDFSTSTTTTSYAVTGLVGMLPGVASIGVATPIGATAKFVMKLSLYLGGSYLDEYHTFEMTVMEVMRGDKAWDMVKAANANNKVPDAGYEYLLARIKFVHVSGASLSTSIKESTLIAYSSEGKPYKYASITFPDITFPGPLIFDKVLQPGQTAEGWVTFIVKQSDSRPSMLYYTAYEWFQLY
jgi:hypothetical protein